MEILTAKGAFELAFLIKTGKTTAEAVVQDHIARIIKVNTYLNAVVITRFEEALEEARQVDACIARGEEVGLLAGVPFTVKESISLKGYPITFGSVYRKGVVAQKDAPAVSRLKKEGAIVLGITNTPECCFWVECYNNVYGRTNNPYDLSRTSGGSSGGEAAIIGAGGVPFGLGSDIAGSIRMPAAFCGIFGHLPTSGLVPIDGHPPYDYQDQQAEHDTEALAPYLKIGPMARKAEDLLPLLKILQGATREEVLAVCPQVMPKRNWAGVTVYLSPDPHIDFASSVSDELQAEVLKAGKALETEGATLQYLDKNVFRHAFLIWQSMLKQVGSYKVNDVFSNGHKVNLLKETLLSTVGKSDITFPGVMLCLTERFLSLSEKRSRKYLQEGEDLRNALSALLDEKALLIMPVYPTVAPKHYMPLMKPVSWNYTTPFNAIDFPATSVPTGLNSEGLPLSVQIIARHTNDVLALEAAKLLEQHFGGWVPPTRLSHEVPVHK
jgi:fatty acid amide hydrolase 2